MAKRDLSERVAEAVERALQRQKYVSAVDVLMGTGLLAPVHLERWRQGQPPHLEQVIQCNGSAPGPRNGAGRICDSKILVLEERFELSRP